jgi:methionyl-tRNA formyltransferase
MRITLFTSNNTRHNYLINLLSNCCDELFVVQEYVDYNKKKINKHTNETNLVNKYFEKVTEAQNEIFSKKIIKKKENIKIRKLPYGKLSSLSLGCLNGYLESDFFIVFGSSFIKGDLIDFLIKHKTINIHAGVSPYYRGTDCNFWALFDENPHLVGATIHLISKGLDNGPILYHAMSKVKTSPFIYTMSTVKSAFHSITERINNKTIFNILPTLQNKDNEIRYSKTVNFNEEVIKDFFKKKINLSCKVFDKTLLKDPYFLNE